MENSKPISMRVEELRTNIILTINDSKLPICITEMIVKDIYSELTNLKVQELKQDKEKYQQEQNNKEKYAKKDKK